MALDREQLDRTIARIQAVYRDHPWPWVVGYSGGKDSTAVAQLVWTAVHALPAEERAKPIYVLSSNTQVENPLIEQRIDSSLSAMTLSATRSGLPIVAHGVRPTIKDSFWVNLIGKGYPAPTSRFRWCTERLKINPVSAFVGERVAEHGEVIMALGVRKQESATRAQLMNTYEIEGTALRRHSTLSGAYVFAPIEDWSADDVWTYLLQVDSPWGDDNSSLAALYKSAAGEECPLVVDTSTPSCGQSRFGCWVCTVATADSSMESLVEDGNEWLEPLLELRDFLFETTDPARKHEYRGIRGRDGQTQITKNDTLAARTYTMETSSRLLEWVLRVQEQVRETGPDPHYEIISLDELKEIRRIWVYERGDWDDTVPSVCETSSGAAANWARFDDLPFDSDMRRTLGEAAMGGDLPVELLVKVLEAERSARASGRRGIHKRIAAILNEDWRTEEEILREYTQFREARS